MLYVVWCFSVGGYGLLVVADCRVLQVVVLASCCMRLFVVCGCNGLLLFVARYSSSLLAPRVVVSICMLWRAALFVWGCVLFLVCRCL